MVKVVKIIGLVGLVVGLGVLLMGIRPADLAKDNQWGGIVELRRDITLLNLVNGLYLSQEQIEQLLPILKDVQGRREVGEQLAEVEKVFGELKQVLLANGEIPEELAARVHRENSKLKQWGERLANEIEGMERQIKGILNENQLEIIANFVPCLIPPKDVVNAPRAGQIGGDTGPAERLLARLRKIPQPIWEVNKERVIERVLSKFEERHGKLNENIRETMVQTFLETVEKARNLSDVDFEIQKKDLAKELRPLEPAKHLVTPGKLARFLLDPRLIPILEQRLAAMKK